MQKKLEEEYPILQEASKRLEQLYGSPYNVDLLARLVAEFKLLALHNRKLKKQIALLKLLNERKR
jgi:hypothetical protein